jgi:hypothetical protein
MRRRSHKKLTAALIVLALAFGANHVEHWFRTRNPDMRGQKSGGAVVIEEEGGFPGHNTIGVQESLLPDQDNFIRFSTLAEWQYPRPVPCPKNIKALSGKEAVVAGFMYPLESGPKIKTFCLLRNTQTCCYGGRPQYNQYILVEMKDAVAFERSMPILVRGVFYVDPKPDEGYIYRLEGTSLHTSRDKDLDPLFLARGMDTVKPNPERSGPVVPVPLEFLVAIAVCCSWMIMSKSSSPGAPHQRPEAEK